MGDKGHAMIRTGLGRKSRSAMPLRASAGAGVVVQKRTRSYAMRIPAGFPYRIHRGADSQPIIERFLVPGEKVSDGEVREVDAQGDNGDHSCKHYEEQGLDQGAHVVGRGIDFPLVVTPHGQQRFIHL